MIQMNEKELVKLEKRAFYKEWIVNLFFCPEALVTYLVIWSVLLCYWAS